MSKQAHGHDAENIEPSKFIQIAVVKRKEYQPDVYALDEAGRIWYRVEKNLHYEWELGS